MVIVFVTVYFIHSATLLCMCACLYCVCMRAHVTLDVYITYVRMSLLFLLSVHLFYSCSSCFLFVCLHPRNLYIHLDDPSAAEGFVTLHTRACTLLCRSQCASVTWRHLRAAPTHSLPRGENRWDLFAYILQKFSAKVMPSVYWPSGHWNFFSKHFLYQSQSAPEGLHPQCSVN